MQQGKTEEMEACPFCDAALELVTEGGCAGAWFHPGCVTDDTCLLAGQGFRDEHLALFNRRPTVPEGLVEQIAQTIHTYCSRNMIMTYLDAEEDCEGLARAIAATLSPVSHDSRLAVCEGCGGNGYSGGVMPAEDMRGENDVRCEVCGGSGTRSTPAPDALREALQNQMENLPENQDEMFPSSLARERGLVWLEGWFDLRDALRTEGKPS